jgi:hypothetical protein
VSRPAPALQGSARPADTQTEQALVSPGLHEPAWTSINC